MVFGGESTNEYEMYGFCNKLNSQVIGGASLLLNYFIKIYNPKSILAFADRRYSQGNLYKQLGFKFIKNTKPNHIYYNNKIKETEKEIMLEKNCLKIYDCGNMKFIYLCC